MKKIIQFSSPIKWVLPILVLLFFTQLNRANADSSLNGVFKQLGFSAQEKQDVLAGKLIKRMPKEHSDKELAVTIAFKVNKEAEQLRHKFLQGVSIDKHDGIVSHQFISVDTDFSALQLTAKGQQELPLFLAAESGNKLNLSAEEIKAFNALTTTDAALKQLQHLLKTRYQAYRQGGISAIAPYQRSSNEQYELGDYFNKNQQAMLPALKQSFPEFYKVLINYPKYKPEGLQERFILLQLTIQGRLAFALGHRMSMQENGTELMAARYFYVSHTLNGQQGLGVLLPNDKDSIAVLITRASSDAVAGFGSSTKHFIGRRMMADDLSEFYQAVQQKFAR